MISDNRLWTWRDVHAASLELANRLDGATTICNLCVSRAGFLVAWLAGLRLGCLQILPPSGGHAELAAMLRLHTAPVIVIDDARHLQPQWSGNARCLVHAPEPPRSAHPDASLRWDPPWEGDLIRLYTSGSTGTPQPQARTLGQFTRGAQILSARLEHEVDGGMPALRQIVCSVAPQHMFGAETSVMLPLVSGIPLVDRRPLLPADVQASLSDFPEGTAWIATPMHLRAWAQAGGTGAPCRVVIASTMPLSASVAAKAEALAGAPVLEIYGSTETGAIAMRRTAKEASWSPLQDVRFEAADGGTRVWGTHFPSPTTLPDTVAPCSQGRFELLGRRSDLVKVAGRRTSLAGLNLLLQDLPGLVDGMFYLPDTGLPDERLVLIHEGDLPDRRATQAWLRKRMDPVFLPRTFIHVERMPRSGNGKVTRSALDEIYAAWLARRN